MESILSLVLWIHLCLFVLLFLIAACGRRLGLRKCYIQFLLKLFQFSQNRVDEKRKVRLPSVSLDESDVIEEIQQLSFSHPKYLGLPEDSGRGFHMGDILEYIRAGVSAIVEDTVLTNFVPEEPPCWNLLTRTNTRDYEFVSCRLTFLWMAGFFIRYLFLLPTRMMVLFIGMLILLLCTIIVGAFPEGRLKRRLNGQLSIFCFDFVAGSLSLFATFHNPENRPKSGITVANHTSPIDSMILSTDNVYDMVGQRHGGLLGYFMTLLSRSSTHIWFERSDSKDRSDVARRLKEHAANPDLPPILIFPEGVCVNNTSVVQFKKGAFEVDSVIYPVAIRFDSRFGDAYWWQDAFFSYVLYMMTSWAIVCDVWYLPPVTRLPDETAIAFANRVKAAIAVKGGMSDVPIDGFLKAKPPKADLKSQYQREFAKHCIPSNASSSSTPVEVPQRKANVLDNSDVLCSTPVKPQCSHVLDVQFDMQLADLKSSSGCTATNRNLFPGTSTESSNSPNPSSQSSDLNIERSFSTSEKDDNQSSMGKPVTDNTFDLSKDDPAKVLDFACTNDVKQTLDSGVETDLRLRNVALLKRNNAENTNSSVLTLNHLTNSDEVSITDT